MRFASTLACVLVLAAMTGCVTLNRDAPNNGDDEAEIHISEDFTDDAQVKKEFVKRLRALEKDKKTKPMGALFRELHRKPLKPEDRSFVRAPVSETALTPAEIYETCKKSVVVVGGLYKCKKCKDWHMTTASGFAISESGVIATNYHVVDVSDRATMGVMTSDGEVYPVTAVLAADKVDDVAILQVDAEGMTPLALASGAPVGTPVTVISHPNNNLFTLTQGAISRRYVQHKFGSKAARLSITADFAIGSSGGPVLNECGAVVGMVSYTVSLYSNGNAHNHKDLQMVVKGCVPTESIQSLLD
ncbi:MAG: trypsin-like peptidase domain-containing protein [bacterium]|nr:trypsin-like peptidase domain-containing protein [bacterium]